MGKRKVVCTGHMWAKGFTCERREQGGRAGRAGESEIARDRRARAEELLRGGAVEVYTDGSGQNGAAGWGWVAVDAGEEVRARRGPVVVEAEGVGWRGAERATNNTGELTAALEAIEWAVGKGLRQVVVRYDSEYAAHMICGDWTAKVNRQLVEQGRRALSRAKGAGCEVGWKHVKGHSGDRWNDRADALAGAGVHSPAGGEDVAPDGETDGAQAHVQGMRPEFRAKGGQAGARVEPQGQAGVGVRWVTYQPTATGRVERATTGFGALNMPVPAQPVEPSRLRQRAHMLAARIRREATNDTVTRGRAEIAVRKLRAAASLLTSTEAQRKEMYMSKRPRAVTAVDCDINVGGLEEYVGRLANRQERRAAEKQVHAVLAKAKAIRPGWARLRVEYRYSRVGRLLVEAGHVTGSRVYAIGVDPFKGWDKGLRGAAMHNAGWECDDEAAYVTARIAMVPEGSDITRKFVEHRSEIFRQVGAALFQGHGSEAAQRQWVKRIFAGYDNDAGLEGWARHTQGDHGGRKMGDVVVRLEGASGAQEEFRPRAYWQAQQNSTPWMWENAGSELQEYLSELRPGVGRQAKMSMWKSYALQEAEAAGRNAKITWARGAGRQVLSLQHDGVIIGLAERREEDEAEGEWMRGELTRAVSGAVGYEVRVRTEWCREARAALIVD